MLLECLARNKPVQYSQRGTTRILLEMRRKGWVEVGAPVIRDLEITHPPAPPKPSKFENVWFEVTNSCNLSCKHCYANSGPFVDRSPEMTVVEWKEVTRKVLSYGARKITFIGGEPSLRLDVIDTVSAEAKHLSPDIQLRMFSNLAVSRVRMESIEIVKRWDIEFGTALYGINESVHDTMTRKSGSWRTTLNAIQECLKNDIDVFVGMYLDLREESDVPGCERWLRSLGVKRFEIIAPSRVGRGQAQSWRAPETSNRIPGVFSFTERHWDIARHSHNCFFDHIVVKPDGIVSPCIMTRDIIYGSIKNEKLEALCETAGYRMASNASKDNIPGCRECEFRYACFDCRPDARGLTKNFLEKPDCGYDPRLELGEPLVQIDDTCEIPV